MLVLPQTFNGIVQLVLQPRFLLLVFLLLDLVISQIPPPLQHSAYATARCPDVEDFLLV
jgi:hypothetical protein